jgi:hypothetical protein
MQDNPEVLRLLKSYPDDLRDGLLKLRALIVDTARESEAAGTLEEMLKWGQASYLTVKPKTGTTIRIDRDKSEAGDIALYVNCQSSLVSDWRGLFPQLTFGGDRSVLFRLDTPLPEEELRQMIGMALTYHLKKRKPETS